MEKLFSEVLDIEDVKGAMLFSLKGELVYNAFTGPPPSGIEDKEFRTRVSGVCREINECDVIFETCRLYIRRTVLGCLLIWMERYVSIALVRLQCDMLVAALEEKKQSKGKWRIFRKK